MARSVTDRPLIIVAIIAVLALLPGFFTIPTMDRDEARYSQAATQMMETGDYIDIKFQEQDRHVKPVAFYWMEVVTTQPFGGQEAPIWAYRLPSFLSIIAAALITGWLGKRLGGNTVGVVAGGIIALCALSMIEGRTAKTDAALLLSGMMAQAALYFILVKHADKQLKFWGPPALFWAASGLALIIKGPIIAMVSATTILGYMAWTREWSLWKRLSPIRGILVLGAVALPWFIAITIVTDGAFFMDAIGHALLGKVAEVDDSHGGPFLYYTLLSPLTFWPGSLLLGLGAVYAWQTRGDATTKFLLAWALPTWIIYEFVATKLPHYVFPTFPAIALLMALGLVQPFAATAKWARYMPFGLFAVVTLVIGLLPALGPMLVTEPDLFEKLFEPGAIGAIWAASDIQTAALWISLPTSLIAIAAGLLAVRVRSLTALGSVAGLSIILYIAIFQMAVPGLKALWPSDEAAKLLAQIQGCEDVQVATAGYREPSNVFYFGTETKLTDGEGAAAHLIGGGRCSIALVDIAEEEAFQGATAAAGLATTSLGTIEGINKVKGDPLSLTAYARADATITMMPSSRRTRL